MEDKILLRPCNLEYIEDEGSWDCNCQLAGDD